MWRKKKVEFEKMKFSSISFFCPAYYDENNLPPLIAKAAALLKELANKYEIIIIEDGSPDNTGQVADQLAAKYKNTKVIHHKQNMGYGAALKDGFNCAKYDFICYTDGDGQYDVREFKKLFKYARGYDAVIGYRRNQCHSLWRKIQSRIFNFLVCGLGNIKIRDINCSMKIFKRKVLKSMRIESSSAFIDAEMLIKTVRGGFSIKELPVTHYPRRFGQASGAKPKVVIETFKDWINQIVRFW